MSLRKVVLEGARPVEVEALSRLPANPDYRPRSEVLRRLAAKGWVESYGDAHVITRPLRPQRALKRLLRRCHTRTGTMQNKPLRRYRPPPDCAK